MARPKRKNNLFAQEVPTVSQAVKQYRAAGYIRLSIEDSGKPGSDTLESQKQMVTEYIESRPDLMLTALYCDNGHTGTNFERPEFDRLLAAVRQGEVNCIVVKDLSRFGRNYKETGNYLERIFPFLGVRFIAINDNFDTDTAERNEFGFIVPLKNLMNETYSRDISRKVSSAIEAKERRGEFIGVHAPYGYRKGTEDRHKLEPNPDTAPVVQEIFDFRMQGMGYTAIARRLNERGIPSPGAYLYRQGLSENDTYRDALWSAWNIKEILRSEVYLGHLVQGKRTQASYKQARVERCAPAEEWRISRNTHEALIDAETFAAVQKLADERKSVYESSLGKADDSKTPNLFRRLIFCADCGSAMNRRHVYSRKREGRVYYYSYLCPRWVKKSDACTPKNLPEKELLAIVTDTIRKHMEAVTELERRVGAMWAERTSAKRRAVKAEITAAERELSRCQALHDGLYQRLVEGIITRQEYTALKDRYQKRFDEITGQLERLKTRCAELDRCGPGNPMFAAYRALQSADVLTEELIHTVISRIEVHEDNRMDITLAYQDDFLMLSRFAGKEGRE